MTTLANSVAVIRRTTPRSSCSRDEPGGVGCTTCREVTLLGYIDELEKRVEDAEREVFLQHKEYHGPRDACWRKAAAPMLFLEACDICRRVGEEHCDHGRGNDDGGPDDPDCPCRGGLKQKVCAVSGCGFCKAAMGYNSITEPTVDRSES